MSGSTASHLSQQEHVRQEYLEAMGIQTWFPRCQLPNAQPARPFDWIKEEAERLHQEQPSTPTGTIPTQPDTSAGTSYRRPRASDILKQAHIDDEPLEEDKTTGSTPKSNISNSKIADAPRPSLGTSQFRLMIQSINDDCLVVAEMPHSGLNQFTRFHQHLLNDILLALKITPANTPLAYGEFIWPLPEQRGLMGRISRDDHSAAEAVCAFLSNQYGFLRRKTILLLGQAAARFVIDPQKTFDELRGVQKGAHSEQFYAVTYGLNELMKLPAHKAEAWHDLAPLLKPSETE